MDEDRMFGAGKPCPVCKAPMEERALPSSARGLSMANCPNGSLLDHSTQAVAEAAVEAALARRMLLETVTDLGMSLTDRDHPNFDPNRRP